MEKESKKDIVIQYTVAILFFGLGALFFVGGVGLDGTVKLIVILAGVFGLFIILARFAPALAGSLFTILLGFVVLYPIFGWDVVGYAIGAVILLLLVGGIYRIGGHFHWWNKNDPYDGNY